MLARISFILLGITAGLSLANRDAPALEGRAEVVDGDTLKVEGTTVRLQAVDAPEARQTCPDTSGQPWPCGREATRALARLLAEGPVRCRGAGEDAYGRTLGFCEAGDVDVNRRLVSDGWAFAFARYDNRYAPEEADARRGRRGIWKGSPQAPWDWRLQQASRPMETPVDGCRIKGNVSRSGERIYHMPRQHAYEKTRVNTTDGERWFCSESEAMRAGWRRALR